MILYIFNLCFFIPFLFIDFNINFVLSFYSSLILIHKRNFAIKNKDRANQNPLHDLFRLRGPVVSNASVIRVFFLPIVSLNPSQLKFLILIKLDAYLSYVAFYI